MRARILHISDLHFGVAFGKDLWTNMASWADEIKPDLVVVTGDLVNSPYRWTLRKAVRALRQLQTQIKLASGRPCRIIVVPGNHDTRVLGNVPLRWITVTLLVGWMLAAGLWMWLGLGRLSVAFVALAVAITVYRCLLRNFWRACGDLAPRTPQPMPDLGLIVFPYDSATTGLTSARGVIPAAQLRTNVKAEDDEGFFRLALVHHHPLPIPYDSKHEPLLVLDNAGAFLNEVSRKRIRLILHGHKHHSNYARCSIRIGTADEFEVGVLASGTVTAERDPGPGFNFHSLELSDEDGVVVTPYGAAPRDSSFAKEPSFLAEPQTLWVSRRFEASREQAGCEYAAVASVWQVNADGDVHTRVEHRDFRIVRDGLTLVECPQPIRAETVTGQIERLRAGPLSRRGAAGIQLVIDKQDPNAYSLSAQTGTLKFGRTVYPNQPISYFISYDTLNGCAVSTNQCKEMYPPATPALEWLGIRLQTIPARDLVLVVHLPRECQISGEPELVTDDPREQARVRDLSTEMLYDREAGLIVARISYPVLSVEYRIQWLLAETALPEIEPRVVGQVRRLVDGFLGLANPARPDSRLATLADQLVQLARRDLLLADGDPVEICLMAYDQAARELRVVTSSFDAGDPRWAWRLGYGNGLPGRAFKSNLSRLFIRDLAVRLGTPLYYVPVSGLPVRDPSDIPEAVILSLPLSHPKDPGIVWGVVSVSSPMADSRLTELTEDERTEELVLGGCQRSLLHSPPRAIITTGGR